MAVTWSTTDKSAGVSLSAANLTATLTVSSVSSVRASAASTGKIYFEILTGGSVNDPDYSVAISNATQGLGSLFGGSNSICWAANGDVWWNNAIVAVINSFNPTTAVRLRVAVDIPNKLIWFAVDTANWNNSGTANPATGVGGISFSGITGSLFVAWQSKNSGNNATAKFKSADFLYSAPSGFTPVDNVQNYTIACASGTYTVTGQSATLRVTRRAVCAQGSYAVTGRAMTPRISRRIVLAQGSYAITGTMLIPLVTRRITLAQGSYTMTGQAAAVKATRRIPLDQGSYASTGQALALTTSRNYRIVCETGIYSVTGQAMAPKVSRLIDLEVGSYAITGIAMNPKATRKIALGQGAYAFAGTAATIRASRRAALAAGSYSSAGQATGLRVTRKASLAAGAYTMTGFDAGLNYVPRPTSISISLETGYYRMRGFPIAGGSSYGVGGREVVDQIERPGVIEPDGTVAARTA